MSPARAAALLVSAAVVVLGGPLHAASPVEGEWWTEGRKARVRIGPCADDPTRLCGTIVWLAEPLDETGAPKRDRRNAEEELRDRPILGLPLLSGFVAADDHRFEGGSIYNPEDGKTYSSELELVDPQTLAVSGCVWIFCKSQTWIRYEGGG